MDRIKQIKIALVVSALLISFSSLIISHYLVRDLSIEESNKMEVWAEAMRAISSADENTDLALALRVLNGNNTIPVIVFDKDGRVQTYRNITIHGTDTAESIAKQADRFRDSNHRIRIYLDPNSVSEASDNSDYNDILYEDSLMIKRLSSYPYIQLGVVLVFVFVAIFALLSSKKAEQNKVWVGLSKETAHQLGTPISSMMAWIEILQAKYTDDEFIPEMSKDVKRLQVIAERFSKIGSIPAPEEHNLIEVIEDAVDYMIRRSSSQVQFQKNFLTDVCIVKLNIPLFEWVIENLCKNAIDAMDGRGSIRINVFVKDKRVVIDITDTGKGMSKSSYKTVFKPGYTTKKRGWGLGLSLAKRIVEEYHHGKIYVKRSELLKGTTFRIELKK